MKPRPLLIAVAAALYRATLWAWPRAVRRRFAAATLDAFTDGCGDAYRKRGIAGLVARAVPDLIDALQAGAAERWTSLRARHRPAPAPAPHGTRSPGVLEIMSNLLTDFRFAFRSLWRQPTFTAVAVATLAVAIGANTVIFSVVKGVILDPLPYPDAGRLVSLSSDHVENGLDLVSAADLVDWRDSSVLIEDMAAFLYWSYTYIDGDEPLDVPSMRVSPSLFRILGAEAELGRTFTDDEELAGGDRVVLIAHSFWEQEFGANPSVVGTRLVLDGAPHTVVGVMPAGFDFPPQQGNGFWTTMHWNAESLRERRAQRINMVIAKLAPGIGIEQAEQELDAIAAQLGDAHPDTNGMFGARVRPAHTTLVVGSTGSNAILLLFGAVGFLLLIACANVTNLMLARLTARDREISVRAALGAGRLHLARQFLSETLTLAALGGGLGALLAVWGVRQVRSMQQVPLYRLQSLDVDAGVLAFCFGVTAVVGIAFGLLPARRASRHCFADSLKDGGGSLGMGRGRRLLNALVVLEVAMSMLLVIGAGLMARTFAELMAVDPGFRRDNLLAANIYIPDTLYPEDHQITAFFRDTLAEIETIPGVLSAAAVTSLPMDYAGIDFSLPYEVVGKEPPTGGPPEAQYRVATPDYFETLAIPLLRGRALEATDRDDAPRVMLINETLARQEFADEDPVGESLSIPIGGPHEVVGVVRDLRHYGLGQDPAPEMYIPMAQNPFSGMVVVVRTAGEPLGFVEPVKRAILKVDPRQPVYAFNTMDDLVAANVSLPRLNMVLSSSFAVVALVLATVGIFGVMSYAVTQRTREIGLRMALGARTGDAARLVVGRGMALAGAGIVMGLAGAVAATRLLQSQLFGVNAIDPVVFGGVAVLFLAIAGLASYMPARRASRVDPLIALRTEAE